MQVSIPHVHVLNATEFPAINPNNRWVKNESGLYDMMGGPTGYSLDQYELRECPEGC